jgi:dynein heavy chain 2
MMTSFKTPPKAVEACLAGVLILLGQDDLTWPNVSHRMKESGFVNRLLELNYENVPLALFQKLELHIKTHPEAFDLASVMQVSIDCGTFAKWVMLSHKFYQTHYSA